MRPTRSWQRHDQHLHIGIATRAVERRVLLMAAAKDGLGGAFMMTTVGCERPAQPSLYERPQQKHPLRRPK
jgi:hypothetical protein